MTTILIRPRLLAAIAKWAYQSDDRKHLCMVRFGDGEIVATDGHRAVIAPMSGVDRPVFGLHPKDIAAIAAAHREVGDKYGDIAIDVADPPDRARVTLYKGSTSGKTDVEMYIPARDASRYPPYRQIIPERTETATPPVYCFNAKYLAAIDEVNREHPVFSDGTTALRCVAWSAIGADGFCGPMSFQGAGGMAFIVMPMRGERTDR